MLIIANMPTMGAIERGKKAAADAANAHAIPKFFAFPDALCKLFKTRICLKPMLARFSMTEYVSLKLESEK
ncbi:MAG: hypothetical protein VX597_02175 [Pseudomonadota bacterium]|nr:hypothetical protein [Pseudomonadota bacterium]